MVMEIKREFDELIELKDNALIRHKPQLYYEWDFKKNDILGLDVYKVTKGSTRYANWVCTKCNSPYNARIDSRMRSDCPYCAGQATNETNSLASLRPDIAKEWHPTKNGELTPQEVTCGRDTKAWWLGECDHEWTTPISDRTKENGTNCPYCSPTFKKTLIGFNDIWTVNPDLASLLVNPEDGHRYTEGSKMAVNWKCQDCNQITKRAIEKVRRFGFSCSYCSDGFSYPEKVMTAVLSQLNIQFERQKTFDWAENKIYDFYISELDMIIETHGRQHYDRGFGVSIEDVKINDAFKHKNAIENGIITYIVLDCRKSEINFIKKSVLESELADMFDLSGIDWKIISVNAGKSLVKKVCGMYNSNKHMTQKEIAQKLGISDITVRRHLSLGSELGICEYVANSIDTKKTSVKHMKKPVVQMSLNENFLAEWSSLQEAGKSLNKSSVSSISACCKGNAKTSYGYKWMYKHDYDRMIQENLTHEEYMNKYYPKTK